MKKLTITFLLILSTSVLFAQWTVETVPDMAAIEAGFVSDPDNILAAETIDSLNATMKFYDDSGYVQMDLVVLQSIGDEDPKTFATALFDHWRIGDSTTNNGFLILLIMDQRTVSFEVGYGLEDVFTDAECYQIQQVQMVPHFKQDDYDAGIINGVSTVTLIASNKIDPYTSQSSTYNQHNDYSTDDYEYTNDSKFFDFLDFEDDLTLFQFYILINMLLIVLFVVLLIISYTKKDRYKRYQMLWFFSNPLLPIIFPFPHLFSFIFVKAALNHWRNAIRISPSGKEMHRLSEEEDDKYLKKGQVTEEKVKSIDYDVWTTDDHNETLVLAYKRWFSKYKKCPSCKYKTYYLAYRKTITAATYDSDGEGEKKYSCKNCGHSVITRYTIPQKTRSSETSSSYSSSGGGSRSYSSWGGSSSSSSSSYSRSRGGGRSGGGGASSSW